MIYLFGIIVTLLIASFIPSVGGQNTVLSINNKNITAENLLKLLCMLPMFLISALRFNVGSDFLAVYWNEAFEQFVQFFHLFCIQNIL